MGTPSANLWDLSLSRQNRRKLGNGARRPERFRPLSRRSGRIPASPYPPLRCLHTISSMPTPFCRYYGSEFAGRASSALSPPRPVENGFVESFTGRLRDECLNAGQPVHEVSHEPTPAKLRSHARSAQLIVAAK